MNYSRRVTKRQWYACGAWANSRCWRRQRRGVWFYYIAN